MNRRFWVLAYAAEGVYYGSAGQSVAVDCNHTSLGVFGLTATGKVVPLDGAEFVGSIPVAVPAVGIPHTTEFPDATQPNLVLKTVTKIKDNAAQVFYYVDTADYNTKKIQCNPVPYASACPPIADLTAGTPTDTTVTITWTNNPAVVGYEYSNDTAPPPSAPGTFLPVGTASVALTGLTASTDYTFSLRTICTGDVKSDWVPVTYTTAAP